MTFPVPPAVCDHGHPKIKPWSDAWGTTGKPTCTCRGSGRETTTETERAPIESVRRG